MSGYFKSVLAFMLMVYAVCPANAADPPDPVVSWILQKPVKIEIDRFTFILRYVNGQVVLQGPEVSRGDAASQIDRQQRWVCRQGDELNNLETALRDLKIHGGVRLCLSPETIMPYEDTRSITSRFSRTHTTVTERMYSVSLDMNVSFLYRGRTVYVRLTFPISNARSPVYWQWSVAHFNAMFSGATQNMQLFDPLGRPVLEVINRLFDQLRNRNSPVLRVVEGVRTGSHIPLAPHLFNCLNSRLSTSDCCRVTAPKLDAGSITGSVEAFSPLYGGAEYRYVLPVPDSYEESGLNALSGSGGEGRPGAFYRIQAELHDEMNIICKFLVYAAGVVCIIIIMACSSYESQRDY